MPENTFDVVSKIDLQEVANAISQATKEVIMRFDLKDSKSSIAMEGRPPCCNALAAARVEVSNPGICISVQPKFWFCVGAGFQVQQLGFALQCASALNA